MGCDGVWEKYTNEEAGDFMQSRLKQQ